MPVCPTVALCAALKRPHCASFGAVPRALAPHCDHVKTLLVSKPPPHLPGARVFSEPDIGIPWNIVGGPGALQTVGRSQSQWAFESTETTSIHVSLNSLSRHQKWYFPLLRKVDTWSLHTCKDRQTAETTHLCHTMICGMIAPRSLSSLTTVALTDPCVENVYHKCHAVAPSNSG